MEHKAISSGESRANLYREVTDRIILELEQGRVPWVRPWGEVKATTGLPMNALTNRHYSGVNILILWGAVIERGYASQIWLTFRQALELGEHVRKGEKGVMACHADKFIPKEELQRVTREGGDAHAISFLKRFTLFNVEQCEGLPVHLTKSAEPLPECQTIPHAEILIKATGADFRIGGNNAFYSPTHDFIQVPPQSAFFQPIDYYRTCFHELGHWSGAKSRLDRNLSKRFDSHAYAAEELVAEMASAFLCASLNIQPTVRHADYMDSWLEVLRNDTRAIFTAASLASKAADYILAFKTKSASHECPA
ncbi:MAG TPA: zincin-like metallopeptidase domain-containing protein [Dongiaceae bacterium]|jgi:antirestriction protein ArdC|nr:zincin-like metallopeptidase domain-containing protein [Dongiaceae bacterium]